MVKIEDHCVDCGLPCLGSTCPMRNVEVHYCDNCGNEIRENILELEWGDNRTVDGEEFCDDCLEKFLDRDE